MDTVPSGAENSPMSDYETALLAWLPKAQTTPQHGPAPRSGEDEAEGDDIFGGAKPRSVDLATLERVSAWTRKRFSLAADDVVTVAELTCQLPGCPPLETVVTFWQSDARHHFKLLKPVAEVEESNLPYAWLKDTLVAPEGFGCDCC